MNRRSFFNLIGKASLFLSVLPYSMKSTSKLNKGFLMGKSSTLSFTKIKDQLLENETATQYLLLQEAAKLDGIDIQVVSAFRSFEKQKEIFEYKYSKLISQGQSQLDAIEHITQYSSIPGTSRHHWGTDIDIILNTKQNKKLNNVLLTKHFEEGGIYHNLHLWMQKNAANYGFYLAYTNDSQRSGYLYEPWHYSYLPKSKPYLKKYVNFDMAKAIEAEKIEALHDLNIDFLNNYISKYVLGVNSVLK